MSWNQQQQYNGRPSSGRDAYYHHQKEKEQQQRQQTVLVVVGCVIFTILVCTVYYLSGREIIPLSYVHEGQAKCMGANYLCPTICGNLPGHYKDEVYKIACESGCNEWGVKACRKACESNDLLTCTKEMTNEGKDSYCRAYSSEEEEPSPYRACLIGVNAVSTTDWPCKQGVTIIGKILASHSLNK
jgi:hypothetical protein